MTRAGKILFLYALALLAVFALTGQYMERVLTFYGCVSALAGGLLLASKVFTVWKRSNR